MTGSTLCRRHRRHRHSPPDQGPYNAKLDGLEVTSTKYGAAFKFDGLVEVPGEGPFELSQLTSTATTGGSRAGQTIKVLLGRLLAPGEEARHEPAGRQDGRPRPVGRGERLEPRRGRLPGAPAAICADTRGCRTPPFLAVATASATASWAKSYGAVAWHFSVEPGGKRPMYPGWQRKRDGARPSSNTCSATRPGTSAS